jgi:tetratricopeptide (TPR) repeat protein
LRLRPTILDLSFEFSKKVNVQQEIMKKYFALNLVVALAFCLSQSVQAQANKEAAKFAREGAEASKNQDWEKAIDLFRKATDRDRKFAPNLAVAYQQRGFAAAKDQKFQDAIRDFGEAIKINSRDARIYEQRAAVEMKMNDSDKALADYSEAIKLSPDEVRYYLYRGYIYERKGDVKNSMADTEKALKLDNHNAEALSRKERLQKIQSMNAPLPPPPPRPAASKSP